KARRSPGRPQIKREIEQLIVRMARENRDWGYDRIVREWEIVALVKALNVVAIETFVTDLHPGAQRAHGRKFLDGEPDRLRCGRKAAIAQRLSGSALALSHEQLGGYAVVEWSGLALY